MPVLHFNRIHCPLPHRLHNQPSHTILSPVSRSIHRPHPNKMSRWNSLDIFWDNVYRYDTKVGSCCIQTVSGEYYLTLSIVAIYDRGQLQYRRQRWLRGGDWNGSESGDWQVVTISDTLIYRGIFGVILYSSDGIY